jgi:hypothetical protein
MSEKYGNLKMVYEHAYNQASQGKGKERHSNNDNFLNQPIFWIEEHFKSFQLGQAIKKIHESQRLDTESAIKELLGAMNYIAAHVIQLQLESYRPEKKNVTYPIDEE